MNIEYNFIALGIKPEDLKKSLLLISLPEGNFNLLGHNYLCPVSHKEIPSASFDIIEQYSVENPNLIKIVKPTLDKNKDGK